MSQFAGFAVVLLVILVLLDSNAVPLQKFFLLLLLLFTAVFLMFKQRLPRDFRVSFLILILGPTVLLCLLSALKLQCQSAF